MTTYATQTPILIRMFSQPDFSQEPFSYQELEVIFTFIASDQRLSITSNVPNTSLSLHAKPDLCAWNEDGFWVWNIEVVDAYFLAWIMAHKDKLKVDLSDMIKQWIGEYAKS